MQFFKSFFFFFFLFIILVPGKSWAQDVAAWVVRFDIETKEKVDAICQQAHEDRFDRLLVQVRGRADAYYQSDLVPRGENIAPDFDPLAEVLSKCKDIEVDAWLNVYYLWTGDTPPDDVHHPALKRSWLIKDAMGRRVDTYSGLEQSQRWIEGVYADPASESYRRYFVAAVVELVRKYPVHGIHLDFVRYPGSFFGAGGQLAQEFAGEYGIAVQDLPEKLSRQDFAAWLNGSLSQEKRRLITARILWDYRRAAEVTKLVAMVRSALLHARPTVRLSASVFPDPVESFFDKGQDWPGWLADDLIDELFIMNYFGDKIRVQGLYDEVMGVVGKRDKLWLGLGSYIKSPEDIAAEMALCAGGDQSACFFSLGHFLSQRKSVRAYVDAVRNQQQSGQVTHHERLASRLVVALENVKACLASHDLEACKGQEDLLTLTENDGEKSNFSATENLPWLDLRGIFRYVNPYDGLGKVEEQLELAQESHELLVEGESFQEVAREYSQAGSRHYGGVLPRRYLQQNNRLDGALADLEPGQISQVIPVYNGFWVYQVLAKSRP